MKALNYLFQANKEQQVASTAHRLPKGMACPWKTGRRKSEKPHKHGSEPRNYISQANKEQQVASTSHRPTKAMACPWKTAQAWI
jgi:hypothetical protein